MIWLRECVRAGESSWRSCVGHWVFSITQLWSGLPRSLHHCLPATGSLLFGLLSFGVSCIYMFIYILVRTKSIISWFDILLLLFSNNKKWQHLLNRGLDLKYDFKNTRKVFSGSHTGKQKIYITRLNKAK